MHSLTDRPAVRNPAELYMHSVTRIRTPWPYFSPTIRCERAPAAATGVRISGYCHRDRPPWPAPHARPRPEIQRSERELLPPRRGVRADLAPAGGHTRGAVSRVSAYIIESAACAAIAEFRRACARREAACCAPHPRRRRYGEPRLSAVDVRLAGARSDMRSLLCGAPRRRRRTRHGTSGRRARARGQRGHEGPPLLAISCRSAAAIASFCWSIAAPLGLYSRLKVDFVLPK